MHVRALIVAALLVAGGGEARAQPEPGGKHPRMLLDAGLRARWKAQAKDQRSAVHRAIERCERARKDRSESDHSGYQGLGWARDLQACLVAWAATGDGTTPPPRCGSSPR